jgi:GNAT superfamily N-acetyltransferase
LVVAAVGKKRRARLKFGIAELRDAAAIARLRNRAAERLTIDFGGGHWSSMCSEQGVAQGIRSSRVLVARRDRVPVATLRLTARKPWAIGRKHFVASARPIYLVDMAVDPACQGVGIGRALIEEATRVVKGWPGDAIRLDAYDAPAGAGAFYLKCGFREVGRATYRATPLVYFEFLLENPERQDVASPKPVRRPFRRRSPGGV